MSFLDHLEELRFRLFKAAGAVMVGCLVGWFLVQRFALVAVLKAPIAPYLPDGKLIVLSPTEPLMIVLKLAVILGCLLASPVVIWQVWGFLSPALYERERKVVVPALAVGVVLFLLGAAGAFIFVVPQALEVLFSFQTESLATMITFEKYFEFVVQLMLAMGISFELPLVIMILASFGLVTPAGLNRFRRVAIILSLIAGAILSPGTDIFSMLMLSIPLILLYEVGFLGTIVIWRRKLRAAVPTIIVLALLAAGPAPLQAQVPPVPRPPTGLPGRTERDSARRARAAADSVRARADSLRPGGATDTSRARRLGLPTAPTRPFPSNDSVLDALLRREGYESTRFQADTATLFVDQKKIDLQGRAMTERAGSILEAQRIGYEEANCVLDARGDPKVFDQGTVLVGEGLRYNTCEKRAVVSGALTNFQEGGVEWFMRGTLSQDSTARRVYASGSEMTSCDLPVAHYHFASRQSKWISKTVLVARPAVLYVRDVPLLWLPFIFQDGRPGRRSGILVPEFGINDIVRPGRNYSRQVKNVGYYWAPTDYFDATARFDWYAQRQWQAGVGLQYRWLDRFLDGNVGANRLRRDNGSSSLQLVWNHRQQFSLTSLLNMHFNYVSNTEVRNVSAIDPTDNTRQISSSANYQKRFPWGTFSAGGNRQQSLTDGSVSQQFPVLTFSPNPLDIGGHITWSPAMSYSQDRRIDFPTGGYPVIGPGGAVDTLGTKFDTRVTNLTFDTPLRIGWFDWANSFRFTDRTSDGRIEESVKVPDPSTPDPNDSITVARRTLGDFSSELDWNTGIKLPILFRGSWKVTPSLRITNVTTGPFLIRNRVTGGEYVAQSKRAQFSLTANPTFFGRVNLGFGPFSAIRHSLLPTISYAYSPEADIPEAYARAVARANTPPIRKALASQTLSFGLQQAFEAKSRAARGDTSATPNLRKFRLLSINTSSVGYDFEQAKEPRRTGWITQGLTNSIASDLVPNLTISLTHDLWDGPVGYDSATFSPYLTGVSAGFGLNGGTFRSLGRLFGLGSSSDTGATRRPEEPLPSSYVAQASGRPRSASFGANSPLQRTGRTPFQARFNFTLDRARPEPGDTQKSRISLGYSTSFSPTPFWSMEWTTQYNITDGRFESHIIRLERDLHEWRASFNFMLNPTGNSELFFNIALLDLPDIKFDYKQTTLTR